MLRVLIVPGGTMSRFLFYSIAASSLAVSVVHGVAALSGMAPDAATQREKWQSAPATASIVRAAGPFEVHAAIACSLVTLGSFLADKSADGLAKIAANLK